MEVPFECSYILIYCAVIKLLQLYHNAMLVVPKRS
jgi:hypothetical protein